MSGMDGWMDGWMDGRGVKRLRCVIFHACAEGKQIFTKMCTHHNVPDYRKVCHFCDNRFMNQVNTYVVQNCMFPTKYQALRHYYRAAVIQRVTAAYQCSIFVHS